jgi:hypothetical protein
MSEKLAERLKKRALELTEGDERKADWMVAGTIVAASYGQTEDELLEDMESRHKAMLERKTKP